MGLLAADLVVRETLGDWKWKFYCLYGETEIIRLWLNSFVCVKLCYRHTDQQPTGRTLRRKGISIAFFLWICGFDSQCCYHNKIVWHKILIRKNTRFRLNCTTASLTPLTVETCSTSNINAICLYQIRTRETHNMIKKDRRRDNQYSYDIHNSIPSTIRANSRFISRIPLRPQMQIAA